MDRLKAIQTFTRVASMASFAQAANVLKISRGAVSRHISDLEAYLGAPLFRRSTRHVSLTEVGELYFQECCEVLRRLDEADQNVSGIQHGFSGSLKIVAKRTFGALHLSTAISEFSEHYPEIEICTVLDDQLSDMSKLLDDCFDVAIRISPLPDSSMKAQKLAVLKWIACASPKYLERKGIPHHPRDLQSHNCLYHLHHSRPTLSSEWRFKSQHGATVGVRVSGGPSANNVMCLRSAAHQGLGITLLPTYCIGEDLRAGLLVPVLEKYPVESRTLYAIYPSRTILPQKVRTFVRFLQDRYRRPPWDAKNSSASSVGKIK